MYFSPLMSSTPVSAPSWWKVLYISDLHKHACPCSSPVLTHYDHAPSRSSSHQGTSNRRNLDMHSQTSKSHVLDPNDCSSAGLPVPHAEVCRARTAHNSSIMLLGSQGAAPFILPSVSPLTKCRKLTAVSATMECSKKYSKGL